MLNKFITKDISGGTSVYTLSNENLMSRYLFHYSTADDDYTNIYLKLMYNIKDYETVNRETLVLSDQLFPMINQDSSKLYFDIVIDSTTSNISYKYTLFDLSEDDIIYINNKYLCHVKTVVDSTEYNAPDYTIDSTYQIEFVEFDDTGQLDSYMESLNVWYDFTNYMYMYLFNIRTIKKLNFANTFYNDASSEFFSYFFQWKTFFGFRNRSSDTPASSWNQFFTSPSRIFPITYSGVYDTTNNSKINILSLLNSFFSDKYTLPYDVTIIKDAIVDDTAFDIELFISNSSDVSNFVGDYMRNGIYIFNEAGLAATMVLRLEKLTVIDPNTFNLKFRTLVYDDT